MAVGRSLHVGINQISPAFPGGGKLEGAENDAQAMRDLVAHDFQTELIPGPDASRDTILSRLLHYAEVSHRGDIFLFTFAGHGTSRVREQPDHDEPADEAIVLTDRLLFDDELRLTVWPKFRTGVRVLMVADSCSSGTVASLMRSDGSEALQMREITRETRERHLQKYGAFYEKILVPVYAPITANVLLLAACRDGEKTPDDFPNGVFTQALLNVMNGSNPANYRELIDRIVESVGPQVPQLTPVPPVSDDFIGQRPFTI
jgi:metacaspase-1